MKEYLVTIGIDMPYPKTFEFRETASGISTAVSRALRKMKKEVGKKRVHHYRINAMKL